MFGVCFRSLKLLVNCKVNFTENFIYIYILLHRITPCCKSWICHVPPHCFQRRQLHLIIMGSIVFYYVTSHHAALVDGADKV